MRSEQIAEVQREAWAWYDEVQRIGELAVLTRNIQQPDNAIRTSKILEEKYPARASAIISAALKLPQDSQWTGYLIQALLQHLDETAVQTLKQEAVAAQFRDDRVAAAVGLAKTDWSLSRRLLLKQWHRAPDPTIPGAVGTGDSGAHSLVRALVETEAGFDCVAQDFATKAPAYRDEVINLLRAVRPAQANYTKKIERILISQLDDPALGPYDRSVAEEAAIALSYDFPNRYNLPRPVTADSLKNDVLRFKNIWRAGQGLPPLPNP